MCTFYYIITISNAPLSPFQVAKLRTIALEEFRAEVRLWGTIVGGGKNLP
jgi:hypothetical protein